VGRDFPNESKVLYDITKAMHRWKPLKDENWSTELKDLFKEEDKEMSNKP